MDGEDDVVTGVAAGVVGAAAAAAEGRKEEVVMATVVDADIVVVDGEEAGEEGRYWRIYLAAPELEVVEDCTHETGSSYLGVYTVVEP